ncbi:MAG: M23 family metallopeptidase, partial [Gemmatimonadota bacterium]|nr:M23 family metallopeptidase [Gemmatimonadota bacterium]
AKVGWGGGYGNVVEIRHSRGYGSRYAHLRGFAKGLRGGARVRQGDLIGYVGTTGLSTGPHLHYEFHSGGRPIDPNTIRSITGDPIPSGARALFRERVHQQIAAMETKSSHDLLARANALAAPERGD